MENFAKDILNSRAERLEELKKLGNTDVKVAPYNVWNNKKANELKRKLSGADIPADAARVFSELRGKVPSDVRDTVDGWKSYGEQVVEDIKEVGTEAAANTQEFAYDELYSWKQKAGALKDSTKDRLKDIKEDVVEAGKEKVEGVIEKASEGLQSVSHDAWHAIEKVAEVGVSAFEKITGKTMGTIEQATEVAGSAFEELNDRLGGIKEGLKDGLASQAAYDHQRRIGRLRGVNLPRSAASDNSTIVGRISSLFERVKEGLVEDEEVRRASSLKMEWENMDFKTKVGGIVTQLYTLGDDAVEEVMRKLDSERAMGTCFASEPVCPK